MSEASDAVAEAEAAAAQAAAQAEQAYQLTRQILQDGQFTLLPALTLMVADSIQAGLAAYDAVAPAARAAEARVQALFKQYEDALRGKT